MTKADAPKEIGVELPKHTGQAVPPLDDERLTELAEEPAIEEGSFRHSWATADVLYKSEAIDAFGMKYLPGVFETKEACERHPKTPVFINFASFRSVHKTAMEAIKYLQIKTVATIAEGVPEQQTEDLIKTAKVKEVGIIGPAIAGGIKPGCLRIGNTGGMHDNIVMSRLYRPGSVAYVSKSGGGHGQRAEQHGMPEL